MPKTKTHPLIGFTLHHARGMYRFALAPTGLSRVGVPANEQTTERRGKNLNWAWDKNNISATEGRGKG